MDRMDEERLCQLCARLERIAATLETRFLRENTNTDDLKLLTVAFASLARLEVVEHELKKAIARNEDEEATEEKAVTRLHDKCEACLLGSAVGDALGAQCEFQPRGSFEPISEMVGGGRYSLSSGMWTDDFSMALCLGESLIEKRKHDPADQCRRYVAWYREAHLSSNGLCFDIGMTVSKALIKFEGSGNPYSGPRGERAAGNGCLMRLAPVPVFYQNNPSMAIRVAGDQARTTHGPPEAIDCCRYFCALVIGALQGYDKGKLLSPFFIPEGCEDQHLWDQLPMKVSELAKGSYKSKTKEEIKNSGYVVLALEAALWGFYQTQTFEDGLILLINLGDDSDTIGAIYGILAGAYYGSNQIPIRWSCKIMYHSLIREMARELLRVGIQIHGNGDNHNINSLTGKSVIDTKTESQIKSGYSERWIRLWNLFTTSEKNLRCIVRKCLPGPHEYKSKSTFNGDVADFSDEFSCRSLKILESVPLNTDRRALKMSLRSIGKDFNRIFEHHAKWSRVLRRYDH